MEITYNGSANTYIQAGPSGKAYTFERGVPQSVDSQDAAWFLGEPAESFIEPEPEPVQAESPEPGAFVVNLPSVDTSTDASEV